MYESFYGLDALPFRLNPDPAFYFDSRQHRHAMAFVEYGLQRGEGFVVVSGEPGTGKTMLARNLLATLGTRPVAAVHPVSTQLDAGDLLRMVAAAFGVASTHLAKSALVLHLEAALVSRLSQGTPCLLIVDEGQALAAPAVEELRLLSNLLLGTHSLLHVLILGLPEFRESLQTPAMEPLRQRVIAACHLGAMDADDTRRYIEHRLRRAGWKAPVPFTAAAFEAIFAASGGVARRINLLCDRVLLSGFLSGTREFPADLVHGIAREMDYETGTEKAPAALSPGQTFMGAAKAAPRVPDEAS
jgi:general secretion pathway protein A